MKLAFAVTFALRMWCVFWVRKCPYYELHPDYQLNLPNLRPCAHTHLHVVWKGHYFAGLTVSALYSMQWLVFKFCIDLIAELFWTGVSWTISTAMLSKIIVSPGNFYTKQLARANLLFKVFIYDHWTTSKKTTYNKKQWRKWTSHCLISTSSLKLVVIWTKPLKGNTSETPASWTWLKYQNKFHAGTKLHAWLPVRQWICLVWLIADKDDRFLHADLCNSVHWINKYMMVLLWLCKHLDLDI